LTSNLCVPIPPEPQGCPSGIQTGKPNQNLKEHALLTWELGKCYIFTFENGQQFGYDPTSKFYTASTSHQFGKFRICTNEICSPGVDIEAGTYFNIQEVYGPPPPTSTPTNSRRIFINNAKNGAYMTRTSDFWESAGFVIAKWPGGKYCLGGYQYDDGKGSSGAGVGLTVEEGSVGATILTQDDQACVVVALTEVPCDIRAETANCIAEKMKVTASPSADGKDILNASMRMPSDGSGAPGMNFDWAEVWLCGWCSRFS
jgi:hypothetical protein